MSYRTKITNKGRHLQRGVIDHAHDHQPYLFGHWRFIADAGDLSDGQTTTRLEPQVAKLLEHFLTHQNQVISRDELITAVWKNRNVSDDAINRCVSILRQILTPENKNDYIETVVRKGYIAHFPSSPDTTDDKAPPSQFRRHFPLVILAGVTALFLFAMISGVNDQPQDVRPPRAAGPPMVAVLPFVPSSQEGGEDDAFFTNGVHDDLLTQLAKLQSMRVISSTSVKEYRGTEHNIRKIGEELGADVILEGSVQIVNRQIRINAQLIDARTDEHLWAETYDRELSAANIFELQSEIASAIANELNTTLTAQDRAQLALIPTENMDAYRAYHRAMQLREADYGALSDPEYLKALEDAVELDPNFARAWAQLVSTLALQNFRRNDPDLNRRVEQALQSLQSVAPGSVEHLLGQAAYFYYALQDYNQANEIISQAVTMNPSDIQALELKSWIERRQGDFVASLETRNAVRKLDPLNPRWTDNVLYTLTALHRYDDAWAEVATSSLDSFVIENTANLLLFREDRDYQRWQEATQELCGLYDQPSCGWQAYIANRNYPKALDALNPTSGVAFTNGNSNKTRMLIFTYWLMKEDVLLAERLPQWQSQLEEVLGGFDDADWSAFNVDLAMLAGIQGNSDESERLVKRWLRAESFDWAERVTVRLEACRVLGMIAATEAAVNCLRDGQVEPSTVHPFLEPYLPFYDSIRDQPEFIEMVAEIDKSDPPVEFY